MNRITTHHRASQSARAGHPSASARAMRLTADLLALIYIGIVAAVASVTGVFYILFPELAALSWDVMERPLGRWAGAPILLAISPPLTGLAGTIVTRTMPYGFASVLITVAASVAIIRTLRSPVAPAISAGLLPLVLGVTSWWYSGGILFGTALLAVISIPWKRYATAPATGSAAAAFSHFDDDQRAAPPAAADPPVTAACSNDADRGLLESPAVATRHLFTALLFFVAIAVGAVKLTGMRFILFPPLVVILYEMLSHREHCPWVGRPVSLPIACTLAAAGGYFFNAHIAFAPFAAMLSMAWGITVLRVLDLHMSPVLAVALLPMVMAHPTGAYPLAVAIGTILASAWYALFDKWHASRTLALTAKSSPVSPLDASH